MIDQLCSVERDRVTAAELCFDELLTIMDRHNVSPSDPTYEAIRKVTAQLGADLLDADGPVIREKRLRRIRFALTNAIPLTDDDIAKGPPHGR